MIGLDTNVLASYIMQEQAQRKLGPSNADFADCLIERIASDAGCSATMTFDVGAAKAAGMSLIS